MATIRPDDLPAAVTVNPDSAIIVDDGATVKKATPLQVVDAAIPLASQAEAEVGTDNEKRVTPLRVAQAIEALSAVPLASTGTGEGAALVSFKLDAAAAFARTVEDRLLDRISVLDFFPQAERDTVRARLNSDDDQAPYIQAALDYVESLSSSGQNGAEIEFPGGLYTMRSGVSYNGQRLNIRGDGPQSTQINFLPVATAVCITLDGSGSAGGIFQASIVGLGFIGATTVTKTAILAINSANCNFERIGLTSWLGDASIAIETRGRQLNRIRDCEFACARPILISANPVSGALNISADYGRIENTELICTLDTGKCIEIGDGSYISNLTIDQTAFVGGKYGFYMNLTSGASAHHGIKITNGRHEQSADATGYSLYFASSTVNIQTLYIDNFRTDTNNNGLYINNAQRVVLIDVQTPSGAGLIAMNITGVAGTELLIAGGTGQIGGTVTMTSLSRVFGTSPSTSFGIGYGVFVYDDGDTDALLGSPSNRRMLIDKPISSTSATVANDGAQMIFPGTNYRGILNCYSGDTSCSFNVIGTFAYRQSASDVNAAWSETWDTANKHIVQYQASGPDGAGLYIQNKSGSSRTYSFLAGGRGA